MSSTTITKTKDSAALLALGLHHGLLHVGESGALWRQCGGGVGSAGPAGIWRRRRAGRRPRFETRARLLRHRVRGLQRPWTPRPAVAQSRRGGAGNRNAGKRMLRRRLSATLRHTALNLTPAPRSHASAGTGRAAAPPPRRCARGTRRWQRWSGILEERSVALAGNGEGLQLRMPRAHPLQGPGAQDVGVLAADRQHRHPCPAPRTAATAPAWGRPSPRTLWRCWGRSRAPAARSPR